MNLANTAELARPHHLARLADHGEGGKAVGHAKDETRAPLPRHQIERLGKGRVTAERTTQGVTVRWTTLREDELYVFTHSEMHDEVKERFATIVAAMDKAAGR